MKRHTVPKGWLFTDEPQPDLSRGKDEPTSQDAFLIAAKARYGHYGRIIDLLAAAGPQGLTLKDYCDAVGVQKNEVSGRFSELAAPPFSVIGKHPTARSRGCACWMLLVSKEVALERLANVSGK